MNEHVWNYVVNKKCEITSFRLVNVATLCFVDSAATLWPSLNELHDVVPWNGFHFTGEVEFLAFLMGLGPSVVLCRSQVGTQLTDLFEDSPSLL